jgi:hypothetical protein
MRLKSNGAADSEEMKIRANAENELYKGLQNIRQSTTELRDILTIMKPLLVLYFDSVCVCMYDFKIVFYLFS